MGRAVHASLPVVALAGLVGLMSCREPTQITVHITTDAKCPSEPLSGPRLVDTTIASGVDLKPKSFVAATKTDHCEPGAPGEVGTLVLIPGGGDNPAVDVLVVAGVELAAPNSDIAPLRLSSEDCQRLIEEGGVGAVGGKPCILARRRLGFVEHTKLELPMDLDTRCIGKKCGEDESCFKGNCVPIDVDCTTAGCAPPAGCDDDCDAGCPSGTGRCTDGACACLPCDAEVCGDTCELVPAVGFCSDDDECLCRTCDQGACTELCGGACSDDAECVCGGTCDPVACDSAGDECSCTGSPESCQCIVENCVDDTCAMQACDFGERGLCGTSQGGQDTCTCTCNDEQCGVDCPQGGSCQAGGCSCTLCEDSQCQGLSCNAGQVAECYQGACACICENAECQADCVGSGASGGVCEQPGTPAGECSCDGVGPGGAPPTGGSGGDGGTTGLGGGGNGPVGGGGGGGSSAVCADYETCPSAPCTNCMGNQGIVCNGVSCGCMACSNFMAITCPGAKVWGPGGICECCGGLEAASMGL